MSIGALGAAACSSASFDVGGADGGSDAASDTGTGGDTGAADVASDSGAPGLDGGSGDATPVDAGRTCTSNAECGGALLCYRVGCGSGATGVCGQPAPTTFAPACGCDNVTHWNAGVAAQSGVAVRHEGACTDTEGTVCLGSTCGTDGAGTCVYLLASEAGCIAGTIKGRCWRVPPGATCGPTPGPTVKGCGSGACRSTCDAIRGGGYYFPTACTPG